MRVRHASGVWSCPACTSGATRCWARGAPPAAMGCTRRAQCGWAARAATACAWIRGGPGAVGRCVGGKGEGVQAALVLHVAVQGITFAVLPLPPGHHQAVRPRAVPEAGLLLGPAPLVLPAASLRDGGRNHCLLAEPHAGCRAGGHVLAATATMRGMGSVSPSRHRSAPHGIHCTALWHSA